ncbi:unnamed protein product [Lepidochelys olivacea]
MVITVHQDLFETGQLTKATDLSLGPAACQHSALNAAANRVIFQMGLHECGSVLQNLEVLLVCCPRLGRVLSTSAITGRADPCKLEQEAQYRQSGGLCPLFTPPEDDTRLLGLQHKPLLQPIC